VPPGQFAASNGLLSEVKKDVSGNDVYCWKSSYPVATYIVSLVITKFEHWDDSYYSLDSSVKMPVDYYSFPKYTEKAKLDWKKTPDMIKYFSSMFGEYPFVNEKYGMAMFGWTSGAMEHQTLTSVGYTLVTGDGSNEDIIAHELAHQWYGNAVTPESWKDVWLNEGFATYLEALWMVHNKGQKLKDVMENKDYGAFNGTVYNPEGFIFNSTVYQKGAWCLHMLRGSLGDSTFFDIMRKYYDTYKYKNASTKDFKSLCEKLSGKDLTDFFDQWIYKGKGRPEYEYSYKIDNFMGDKNDSIFTLRLNVLQKQTDLDVYKMPVRITVVTESGEQEFTVFNFKKKQQFEQPVKGKIKDVILDKDNWILKEVKKVPYKELYD
ncbi:MAG: M1 family metallopeptidase, partial [Ignavibacteria bacterium]